MDAAAVSTIGLGRQTWNFARHFLEMCISMCAGGAVLYFGAAAVASTVSGRSDALEQYPELRLIVVAIALLIPMTGWMRFRGMAWRPILEMGAVLPILAVGIIAASWAGVVDDDVLAIRFSEFCGLACVGMFGVMLFRLDMYTGRAGPHAAHGTARHAHT